MHRLMTTLNVLIICASLFTSCLNSRKVDKQVLKQYGDVPELKKRKQGNNIFITSSITSASSQVSATETKTSNMLPLLVYWQWDYKNTCTLNPQIPINKFSATAISYANKELKSKLGGQHLELSVDKISNKFAIEDKAHLIFLGFAYGWEDVSIKALDMEMIISYRILQDSIETKKGTITIPTFNDKKPLGMFKSWKKATSEYLDQYDANIISMSKMVIDKLVKEL